MYFGIFIGFTIMDYIVNIIDFISFYIDYNQQKNSIVALFLPPIPEN